MAVLSERKLNRLERLLPEVLVVDSSWLSSQDYQLASQSIRCQRFWRNSRTGKGRWWLRPSMRGVAKFVVRMERLRGWGASQRLLPLQLARLKREEFIHG